MLVPAYVFLLHVFSSIRLSGTGEKRTVIVALFLSSVSDPDSSSPGLDQYPDPGF
jgi:hypothetical protein